MTKNDALGWLFEKRCMNRDGGDRAHRLQRDELRRAVDHTRIHRAGFSAGRESARAWTPRRAPAAA